MKFKIVFILILAVFLISITGVCASDMNDTAMASQENTVMELTDENLKTVEDNEPSINTTTDGEILSVSVDYEIVSVENDFDELRDNPGTYSGLSSEIGTGGNKVLAHDYYTYDSGSTIKITQSNSIIDGNGAVIDMNGSNIQAFRITASGVTIKNLTIKNCNVSDNGGAVYFEKEGTVENCNFVNNNVSEPFKSGGAIYFIGAGNVINCNFTDNYASYGGAVYFSTNGVVSGCSFVNNSVLVSGGAVCFSANGEVAYCNFTNNSAFNGAAIYIGDYGIVENCISVNDSADYNGGAIWIANGTVENCIFVNDSADYNGGAVFFDNNGTVKNCNFTHNYADDNGGAVYFFVEGDVTDCIFVNNKARLYGGAIAINYYGSVRNCNFAHNTASSSGGAVIFYENGEVTNCNFTNNAASSSAGAVFINQRGNVTDCIFTNNSADTGGAVRFNYYSNVINCIFVNNSAEDSGGAVYSYQNGEVTNCNFTNNNAEYGGAIDFDGDGAVVNCIFVNNSAEEGGAVYIYETGEVTNCNFINNTATTRGGVLYFSGYASVTKCNFTNNNAGDYGGAVFVSSYGDGNITNCSFVYNAAFGYYGGAIFCLSNTDVTNCNFTHNNAGDCGGAVCFYKAGEVTNCNFISNSAESKAGAVYAAKGGKLSNSNFTNNSAGSNGGAAFIRENGIVENCNFNGNNASNGGAIWLNGTDSLVSGCIFVNNIADNGIIHFNNENRGSNFTINDNIFLNNDGVAIYFIKNDSTSNADYNWFGNNATNYDMEPINTNVEINAWLFLNATANPDVIPLLGSSDIVFKLYAYTPSGISEYDNSRLKAVNLTLTPINGRTNTNRTELGEPVHYTAESGGIGKLTASIEDATYTTTLKISDGTTFLDLNYVINGNDNDTIVLDRDYTYNSTFDGDFEDGIVIDRAVTIIGNNHTINATGLARIFKVQASDVTIENLTFKNAKSDGVSGGAIYWSGANGKVLDCSFVNNYATNYGGAIYFMEDATVENCNFINNNAIRGDGGAVYFEKDGNVTNCSFNLCTARFGGAIDFEGNGKVEKCNFTNCIVNYYGGAVWFSSNEDGNGYCIVESCNFVNNYVIEQDGGAIGFYGFGNVKNCNFTNNNAFSGDGGAIYFYSIGTVENCNFNGNDADRGGAVFFYKNGTLVNCNFTNNTAEAIGGAVIVIEYGTVENCNFNGNDADRGGAIYFYGNGTVENCNFTSNSVGRYGGAVFFNKNGTVENCNFTNNSAEQYAGAIKFNSGHIENCNFINNSGGNFGGAVLFFASNSEVTKCNFINNSGEYGGAVYADADATIEDCNFTDNLGGRFAGAVFIYGVGIVTNCNFNANNASNGGAIWLNGTDSIVSGCVFVNNNADNGTIYYNNDEYGSNFKINDNIFLNNGGVAIYFVKSDSTSNADYNWFGINATDYDMAPINHNIEIGTWLFLNATANPEPVPLIGSSDIVFKLYAYTPSGVSEYDNSRLKAVNLTLTPTNGKVNATRTILGEPVQYNPDSYGIGKLAATIENAVYTITLNISDGTTFYDLNWVINGNDDDTIVLDRDFTYNSTFDCNLNDGIVIDRPVTIIGNGHAIDAAELTRIFNIQADNVIIKNITFINGKSENGGAIYWNGANGNVSGCVFVNNSAEDGGIIFWQGNDGVISGCVFVNNSAEDGIIYFHNQDSGKRLKINNNIFLNNYDFAIHFDKRDLSSNADYNWFGINATDYDMAPATVNVVINNWLFLNATANPDAISVPESSDILFKLYSYSEEDNGISDYDNSKLPAVNLTLTPTNGKVNTTRVGLGEKVHYTLESAESMLTASIENAFYTPTLKISDGTTFRDLNNLINRNDNDTIVLDNDYTYDPTFDGDFKNGIVINRPLTIVGNGHAINADGQARIFKVKADDVTISNITFANAKIERDGYRGGAIYWNEGANGVVSGCSFVNNYADMYGGAIYWNDVNGNVYDCIFVNNSANSWGGAIYWYAAKGNVYDCSFANNSAKSYAGAIFWYAAEGNVSGCSFVNNSANNGGAILWNGGADGIVSGCSFANHSVKKYGGAIYWNDAARGVVSDCSFVNSSSDRGGAIYWDSGARGVVSGCSFVNSSTDRSSTVYWYANDGLVSGCSFVNISGDNGVIYFASSNKQNLSVNDNIFLDNDAVAIYFYKNDPTSNANYNWFGNNATNYDIGPSTTNLEISTWLFLNATADPNPVQISKLSDISFKLYSYNASGISDYDNSRLQPVNLTLTATNGDVDSIAKVGETVKYDPDSLGAGSVTAKIENIEYTIEMNIVKSDPNLSVESSEVTYANSIVISLDYDSAATGKVNITLNGKKSDYTFKDLDLNATFSLGIVGADEYDVLVEYSGDDLFANASATGTLTVNKANSTLTVSDIEFDYKEMGSGEISFTNATGVDAKVINHDEAMIFIRGNTITVLNLSAGSYILAVTTITDANHSAVTENATINVRKVNSTINVNDIVIYYGESVNVTVATEGADGITAESDVDVEVNGKVITIPAALKSGNHTLTITTVPDANHVAVNKVVNIVDCRPDDNVIVIVDGKEYPAKIIDGKVVIDTSADKLNTSIALDVSCVENNATFTVTVNSYATGIVRFEVFGAENYTVYADVLNGKAVMDDVLSVGDYTVVATYLGDDIFNSNITSEIFTVKGHVKKDTPISADAKVNGNLVTITVDVDENATGFIGLTQSGSTIYVALEDGVASYVNKFASGSYNVEVVYVGDDDYNANSTRLLFTVVEVAKENTTIGMDVSIVENNANFTVNVNPDATGIVRFEVSGAENYTVYADVLDGVALMGDILSVGNYTIVATYMGDSRFNSNGTSQSFTVKGHVRKDTPISGNADVNGYKVTISVSVDENATGFVNIKLADSEFNVALVDGAGSFAVNLAANSYIVDVTYLGDVNFNQNSTRLSFTVEDPVKDNTPISIDVSCIENNVDFTVSVNSDATGIVKFEVSGTEEYTVYADVLNGKAVMEDVLSVGDYTVVATYLGDDRFNSNITSEIFTVKGHVKKDTPISVDAKVNGNIVTITVNVNESATGFIGLKQSGSTIYVALEDGVASYVNKFASGSYNVEVIYVGDDDYNANSTRLLFTVVEIAKKNTPIELVASSIENNATFIVSVNSDATGIVRFEVSGAENYTVYADVLDGKAVMEDVLKVGDYTVVATYMGDGRFNTNATSESFAINGHVRKDTPISANADVNGYKVTISVDVDENATGFVNIKLVDSEFNVALVDGAGSFAINLAANSYIVDVTYLGDVNFNQNSTRLSFTVEDPVKDNTPISIDVSCVENNVDFTVNVNSDATGIVKFEVSGTEEYTVYADVLNGKAVMEDVLSVGDYTVVATYLGDDRFNSNITSEIFTVKGHVKKDTPISADVKVNGNIVTITVNVDKNATGFVGLKQSGSTIYIALEDGVASYANTFASGSYNVEVIYVGDDDYNASSTRLLFTVVEVAKDNTPISIDVSTVENNAKFTVNVNPDATGIVRFEVFGAENYTVYADVFEGVAVIEDVLSVGDYSVVATYMGDGRFNTNATSQGFTIKGHVKKDTPISANADVNGYKVTISVSVDENATGFVNIKLADSEFNVALVDGAGSFAVNLAANSYIVDVTYLGDVNFNQNSTRLSFTVEDPVKDNTPISIDVSCVENNVDFTVNVNSDATGIVKFEVSGTEEYTVYADVLGGVAVMGDVLKVGDYTVVATYLGDDRFNSNITSEIFTVKGHVKKETPISVDAKVNGNIVTITVNVDKNATGFVGLKQSGSTIYIALEDGVASYVNKFASGSYNVEVVYVGDDDYNANSTRLLFTVVEVAKDNTSINIDVSTVENNAKFTVNVNPDASGIVRFEVSGAENYTVYADVLNGKAVMEDVLSVGDYSVVATYMGDGRFNTNATSESFAINGHVRKDTPISANADVNGYKVTIGVSVDENATGFANIKFVDSEFNVALVDGAGSFAVNLAANSYIVDVTYLGDVNFNQNSTRLSFTVEDPVKDNTPISIDVSCVENNVDFTVNVNSDATGIVKFEVSGTEEYTVYADVLNGKAVMEDVLKVGDYTVVATYLGDDRFNSNITYQSFTIRGHIKKDTPISADAKVNGNIVTITVNVNESATGFIGLKQSGSTIYISLENGVASYANTFASGSYNVEVIYGGDDDYNANSTRLLFTVVEITKENTPIELVASSVENNVTFTVNVNSDATGIVRFEVSGAENYTVYADVLNGKAVMEDVLKVGDYAVVATYMGDGRFNTNATSESFAINGHVRKDTPISANADVNGYKVTIGVSVDENATGFANIKFVDSEFNVALVDGAGSFAVNLAANSYIVDVTYLGDVNFNQNSTRLSFTVEDSVKDNTPISIDVSTVENNATFTVNVNSDATGIVRFEVSGGENYTVYADVLNGKAVMEDVLSVGDYTVVATYLGDDRFNSNITYQSFTIRGHIKKDTPISVDAKVNGNIVTITVNVNESATGFVGLKQSGSTIYIALEDGVASYVNKFVSGSYNVEVIYVGDDDYNTNSTRLLFTVVEVSKENTPISIDVSTVENNATFTVNVNSDATGIVRFEVSGAENYTVYADVLNGKAVMEDVLSVGNYTVTVTYMGDNRFNTNSTLASFTITEKNPGEVNITIPEDIPVGEDATIGIELPSDATGNLTVIVDGNLTSVPLVNGSASLTIGNLSAGNHSIIVSYSGDGKYPSFIKSMSANVVKTVPSMDISVPTAHVGEVSAVKITLPADANGKVLIDIEGIGFYADVVNGTASVQISGLTVGVKNLICTYDGDDKYESLTNTTAITVLTNPKITNNKNLNMYYADGSKYTVRVYGENGKPVGAGEIVTFTINKKTYKVKTNKDGYASLKISLVPKTYTVKATYKTAKVSNTVKVKQVLKLKKVNVKRSAKKLVLKATLKKGKKPLKGKKIVFKFNGKKYSAKTNKKGIAKVTIKKSVLKKLKAGKKITYKATYIKNTVKKTVKIKR